MSDVLALTSDDLVEPINPLLPVSTEQVINGNPTEVPIEHCGEIISAKEMDSSKGNTMLLVNIAVPLPPPSLERTEITCFMVYEKGKNFMLKQLLKVLALKPPLTIDDFLGKKVVFTIKHEDRAIANDIDENTGKARIVTENKIVRFVRLPSDTELLATEIKKDDLPF
jgi:hypothetical protein